MNNIHIVPTDFIIKIIIQQKKMRYFQMYYLFVTHSNLLNRTDKKKPLNTNIKHLLFYGISEIMIRYTFSDRKSAIRTKLRKGTVRENAND